MYIFVIKYFTIFFAFLAFFVIDTYIDVITTFQTRKSENLTINSYEYVIVGSGTAGSAIFSSIESEKVLLIEAGVYHTSFLLDVPVFTPALFGTEYDWNYLTESQDQACLGLNNKQSRWPRGKIYGGTHILNNMIHHRGHPDDYRGWFSSNMEYDYETEVKKYFIKSEEKMQLAKPKFVTSLSQVFIESGNELFVDGEFEQPILTQRNGRRWTTSHSNFYYRRRRGHKILTNSIVTKILFDATKSRAVGLEFNSNGLPGRVFATKGVILSAGTIETPKLLMLSGIGSKKDLDHLGIHVVKDLPGVGQNLQDHITTGMDLVLLNSTLPTTPLNLMSLHNIYEYYFHGSGPLTHGGCDGMGFVRTNRKGNYTYPDISFLLMPFGVSTDVGLRFRETINLRDDVWKEYFSVFAGHSVASILPILLHPKSRGTIKLRSTDPFSKPLINPMYLNHPDDVQSLVTGLRMLKTLIEMTQMKEFGVELNPIPFPKCKNYEFLSDLYWECYVRHLTLTMYHPVGTCRMGDPNDEHTVVDYNFKVREIENLYVIDASVMPSMPSGNPNAVVTMLAEKFLDLIE